MHRRKNRKSEDFIPGLLPLLLNEDLGLGKGDISAVQLCIAAVSKATNFLSLRVKLVTMQWFKI